MRWKLGFEEIQGHPILGFVEVEAEAKPGAGAARKVVAIRIEVGLLLSVP